MPSWLVEPVDKVDVCYLDTFLFAPTSRMIWNKQSLRDHLQIQITPVVVRLTIFGAHMNILFIIKVKILVLIKWSYRSPQSRWLLSLEQLAYILSTKCNLFWTYVFLLSVLRPTSNHIPLKYRCPDYWYVGIRHVYLMNKCLMPSPNQPLNMLPLMAGRFGTLERWLSHHPPALAVGCQIVYMMIVWVLGVHIWTVPNQRSVFWTSSSLKTHRSPEGEGGSTSVYGELAKRNSRMHQHDSVGMPEPHHAEGSVVHPTRDASANLSWYHFGWRCCTSHDTQLRPRRLHCLRRLHSANSQAHRSSKIIIL